MMRLGRIRRDPTISGNETLPESAVPHDARLHESLPEVEAVAERLDNEMNTDLEPDCEAIVNNHKSHKQQGLGQPSILTTSNNSSIEMDRSTTMKNQKKVDAGNGFNTLRDIQYVTKDKENEHDEEVLSSCDDVDDCEIDDDSDSTDAMIGITNSLTLAARSKSASVNKVKPQQSKKSLSYASKKHLVKQHRNDCAINNFFLQAVMEI
ncbi:unnamed protein product [Rotaria socialis]|uniref:Uncharacterized protein n=1 Tax=Rotaria socialis TaxID=392032 RepID=A0A818WQ40_9BILA|nr:unnamed protein product [Rotaria socialis]